MKQSIRLLPGWEILLHCIKYQFPPPHRLLLHCLYLLIFSHLHFIPTHLPSYPSSISNSSSFLSSSCITYPSSIIYFLLILLLVLPSPASYSCLHLLILLYSQLLLLLHFSSLTMPSSLPILYILRLLFNLLYFHPHAKFPSSSYSPILRFSMSFISFR